MHGDNWRKFDILRGLASIVVLFSHAIATFLQRLIGSEHPWVTGSVVAARHAVLLFFLLSGFLIARSISGNIMRNGIFNAFDYLVARFVRIYPPLLGAIIVVTLVWLTIHGLNLPGATRYGIEGDLFAVRPSFSLSFKDFALALLMQEGMLLANGPLWSLYIEFHLYIVAMFLACAAGSKGKQRFIWVLMAVMLCFLKIYRAPQAVLFGAVWFLGVACAKWGGFISSNRPKQATKSLVWMAVLALLGIAIFNPSWLHPNHADAVAAGVVQFFSCIVYAYLLFFSKDIERVPGWMVRSGDYSYSLYVIHFPLLLLVLSLTQAWMGSSLGRTLWVTFGAMVFSIFSAVWFAKIFERQSLFRSWTVSFLSFFRSGVMGSRRFLGI